MLRGPGGVPRSGRCCAAPAVGARRHGGESSPCRRRTGPQTPAGEPCRRTGRRPGRRPWPGSRPR
ncbi:hypothetical protein DDW44_20705 [Streptomyces tirandamycinicus]|uniref:Uncharacterized protein n=1 Tax=Streptomyces tirandamycinicus TaxID=2174846 RepID=A0A2S1SWY1_9ACTN|nr:hypothetical protein DDW44_20705 [Streptomyces tirandamycinicus]